MKFLGYVVDESGALTDPDKVRAILSMVESDLIMDDGVTPSQKRIRSFLGMFMYYQQFIHDCSRLAKPLFPLTAAQKGKRGNQRGAAALRKLHPSDWRDEHRSSFKQLKAAPWSLSC